MKRLVLLALMLLPALTFGQIPKPLPNTYVNDFAHVLTAKQVTALNQQIAGVEKASSVQLAIVLIKKLPENYTIEDYTLLLSRKWHIGNYKTGLVYVAAINQHKHRIEHTSGLDSLFTQEANLQILNAIKPAFKTKDYFGGLQILVNQVNTSLNIVQPLTQGLQQTQHTTTANQENTGEWIGIIIKVVMGIFLVSFLTILPFLIIRAIFRKTRGRRTVNYNNTNQYQDYGTGHHHHNSGSGGFVAGAVVGAVGAMAVERIIDGAIDSQGYDDSDDYDDRASSSSDDSSSSWGDWGSSDSSSSDGNSSDSGFSSDDTSSGTSSDW